MSDLTLLGRRAIQYAERQLHVHPLKPGTKEPILRGWTEAATCDVDQVDEWWRLYPNANIGCVTGEKSGIIVLDIDMKNGKRGVDTVAEWEARHGYLPLNDIPVCMTPNGGYHYYFGFQPDFKTCHNLGTAVDLQVDGAQVLLPPSVVDGRVYRWVDEGMAAKRIGMGLGVPPPAWLNWIRLEKGDTLEGYIIKSSATYSHIRLYEPHCVGVRHDALFKFACTLRGKGERGTGEYSEEEICEAVLRYNRAFCEPSFRDRDIERLVESVCESYEAGNRNILEEIKPDYLEDGTPIPFGIEGGIVFSSHYEPCIWIARGIISEGLNIWSGQAKIGKSLLVMQLIKACMEGGDFLGRRVEKARVLYLALEDNGRRLQDRMRAQGWPNANGLTILMEEQFEEQCGMSLNTGGMDVLLRRMEQYQWDVVIIDTLSRAWDIDQNDVNATTHALKALQRHCGKHHTAAIVVDHDRKGGLSGDHILNIGGSRGKPASADNILSLSDKDPVTKVAKLQVTGREAEPLSLTVRFRGEDLQWEEVAGTKSAMPDTQFLYNVMCDMDAKGQEMRETDIWNRLRTVEEKWPSGKLIIKSTMQNVLKRLLQSERHIYLKARGQGEGYGIVKFDDDDA